jgi:glycine/D-amino acid oxidase-like deaminating enzyme
MPLLEKLGERNLREIGETVARHGIDCDFQLTGELNVATAPWQLEGAVDEVAIARQLGHDVEILDAAETQAQLGSPRFVGGLKYTTGNALVDPGRLAWGLRRACLDAGVRIYESTPVTSITPASAAAPGKGLVLTTPYGSVRAGRVVLGMGVFGRCCAGSAPT